MNKLLNEKLMEVRKLKYSELKRHEEKMLECKREIDRINEQICLINGHSFNDWKLIQNVNLDKNCYLERNCEICGKVERNFNEEQAKEYTIRLHSTK